MTLLPVRDAAVAPLKEAKKNRSISNLQGGRPLEVRYGKMIGKLTLKSAAAGNFHKNRLITSRFSGAFIVNSS